MPPPARCEHHGPPHLLHQGRQRTRPRHPDGHGEQGHQEPGRGPEAGGEGRHLRQPHPALAVPGDPGGRPGIRRRERPQGQEHPGPEAQRRRFRRRRCRHGCEGRDRAPCAPCDQARDWSRRPGHDVQERFPRPEGELHGHRLRHQRRDGPQGRRRHLHRLRCRRPRHGRSVHPPRDAGRTRSHLRPGVQLQVEVQGPPATGTSTTSASRCAPTRGRCTAKPKGSPEPALWQLLPLR